jgi:hypothetical protein
VGNYYSLKGQHAKAVKYFQRALRVDRSFVSAWTLLGHECVSIGCCLVSWSSSSSSSSAGDGICRSGNDWL